MKSSLHRPKFAKNIVMAVATLLAVVVYGSTALNAGAAENLIVEAAGPGAFPLVRNKDATPLYLDPDDFAGVLRAAGDLQSDFERVTGIKPILVTNGIPAGKVAVIIGTLGKSSLLDAMVKAGKFDGNGIAGKWEAYSISVVSQPLPGVDQALVIAGSDRRGTIYGIYKISEQIGVSPWYWWADVPVKHHDQLAVKITTPLVDAPAVKYRGIFINDEDWGLNPWASKTFDPKFGNIGPKTYEKVFELMLRLRLNYIWPAMHACSTEFGSVPENIALADEFGIVAGSSHCEPMLCNNVHWNEKVKGPWNYSLNRDTIHDYWEENARARGADEAVWTLGIRGIHDASMEKPPTGLTDRISLVSDVIKDQRALLDQYVTKQWGPVAQCFVPYKEVLPIYDAGLKVPEDVTLVWVDDNFGYIRRFSAPEERKRSGGAGVYWHLSYYGSPHSYTWIDTTAPALIWEELHKAWENGTRNLWVLNVGDIKPGEIGIDYFAQLAWNPDGFALGAQRPFLRNFAGENFSAKFAQPIGDLLMEFYQLGTVRKPELMNRDWALSLTPECAQQLELQYENLLAQEKKLSGWIPAADGDAYTELVGFPVRVLGTAGLIFMADRKVQAGIDAPANEKQIEQWREDIEAQVRNYNTNLAGGKWNHIMPGLVTGRDLAKWSSQVRWPWGEPTNRPAISHEPATERWRDAAAADQLSSKGTAHWSIIEGLGPSGRAVALEPASLESSWAAGDINAPSLEYRFQSKGGDAEVLIDFLPTFRICPGMKLRVAVTVDDGAPAMVEVPGSNGIENENGTVRSDGVQNNYVRAQVPLPHLAAGHHTFVIHAVDPGVVVDRISLP
jgi:hypothetical protein